MAVETLFASKARGAWEYDTVFARAPAAVLSFWNDAARLRKGVHTVALSHGRRGELVIDNLYGLDPAPNREFSSIRDLLARTSILPILLVTVQKKGSEEA